MNPFTILSALYELWSREQEKEISIEIVKKESNREQEPI